MLEEELAQLQQMKKELQQQVALLKELTEQQQKQIGLLEKHTELHDQIIMLKELTEQQQKQITLLKVQNTSQEERIKALAENTKAPQEQLAQSIPGERQPLSSRRLLRQIKEQIIQGKTRIVGQQGYYKNRKIRLSPPTIAMTIVLIMTLVMGSWVYGAAIGHLPWPQRSSRQLVHSSEPSKTAQSRATAPSATAGEPGKTEQAKATAPSTTSSGASQLTIPGLFTISGGISTSAFFRSSEGSCLGTALSTNRLTYTTDELQEMYNYYINGDSMPLPQTLTQIDGGSTTSSPSMLLPQFENCPTGWEITNIGQQPIQLVQLRMKLLAEPTAADTQYRLVDYCSVLREVHPEIDSGTCPGLGGQVQPISYMFFFGSGHAGTVVQGQSTTLAAPKEQTIVPKDTAFLQFRFMPDNLSLALTYTIEPEVVINTPQETNKVIDLPQWKETFVMAPDDHFGCYQLQGKAFVPVTNGAICF
ncbi:hypothetical protein [Dictyobacter aurantiacus]|uniref:Uncharacterized protein n=1 Tax=Dictyobacter aurantiacus TaxID=1936993 RepID=A0A401ZQZ2_9CHLR|nr:hypothetical protein [Dictyobacter aurantiacus]GCE09176.1 hypothetical protein KDAU_65050 [Dictyobacter aurantiacus]